MNTHMPDFFDERYFSPNCSCTDFENINCLEHSEQIRIRNQTIKPDSLLRSVGYHTQNSSVNIQGDDSEEELSPTDSASQAVKTDCVEINQSFPRQPTSEVLSSLIEYRIKLVSKEVCSLGPGEVKRVYTTLKISRKPGKLAMFLKPPENIQLRLLNDGYINPLFRGALSVQLQNPNSNVYTCSAGTIVGFIILTPFAQC